VAHPIESSEAAAVFDVSADLARIRELVRVHIGERRAAYDSALDAIEARARDPRFYVAVVGEFSSGKSTFINALLRHPLLRASRLPTTATVTRIESGPQLSVTVTFRDRPDSIHAAPGALATLRDELLRRGDRNAAQASLERLLDTLTTNPAIAGDVAHLVVTVPSQQLEKNLVILDTPGINAGAEEASRHAAVTKTAMSESVDATVVLIPSEQAMSHTLLTFLETDAKPFLPRTIFVLTSMDLHMQHDQARIADYTRKQLIEKAGIADPAVLQVSSTAMLPHVRGAPDGAAREQWQARFVEAESFLRAAMLRQRNVMISERLIRLLQELVARLDADLATKEAALQEEQTVLRNNSVEAISKVMTSVHRNAVKAIDRKRREVENVLSSYRASYAQWAKKASAKTVAGTNGTLDDFQNRVRPQIASTIELHGSTYVGAVKGQWSELGTLCGSLAGDLAAQFKRNYAAFQSLAIRVKVPAISVGVMIVPSVRFDGAVAYLQDQSSRAAKGAGLGGAIGLALATVLGVGIPVVIGAAIASSLLGSGISGDSLDVQRATIRQQLDTEIDRYFHAMHEALRNAFEHAADDAAKQLRAAADRHVAEYGAAVETLIREHQRKERALTAAISSLQADRADLANRNARLVKLKRELARTDGNGRINYA